jgi:hypothetical protein
MIQDVGIGAAGVLQGVGEDGESVEGTIVIDRLGETDDGRGKPTKINEDRPERVAEEVMNKLGLEACSGLEVPGSSAGGGGLSRIGGSGT